MSAYRYRPCENTFATLTPNNITSKEAFNAVSQVICTDPETYAHPRRFMCIEENTENSSEYDDDSRALRPLSDNDGYSVVESTQPL